MTSMVLLRIVKGQTMVLSTRLTESGGRGGGQGEEGGAAARDEDDHEVVFGEVTHALHQSPGQAQLKQHHSSGNEGRESKLANKGTKCPDKVIRRNDSVISGRYSALKALISSKCPWECLLSN